MVRSDFKMLCWRPKELLHEHTLITILILVASDILYVFYRLNLINKSSYVVKMFRDLHLQL